MQKTFVVTLKQQEYFLEIIKQAHLKRITLRFNLKDKKFKISMPKTVSQDEALKFFNKNYEWALKQVSRRQVNLDDCDNLLFKGEEYKLLRYIGNINQVELDNFNKIIKVYATQGNLLTKVLITFLKQQAQLYFYNLSKVKAQKLQVSFNEVGVMDNISNWGSCSTNLKLSYNFRLIMAPLFVIDYIVAHEVAHLKEFNHSDKFWQVVKQLTPYAVEGRQWLKEHGRELY